MSDLTIDKMIDELVKNGLKALEEYENYTQEQVDHIVGKASVAALDHHGELALLAVQETQRGVFEDKATKNLFASEYVINHMRNLKTVGLIHEDPVTGIAEYAEPVGVVAGITPVTNPTSTAIFKSLICLKTRNPIIFAFHPSAQESSKAAAKVMRDAAVAAGAPKDCIQWIDVPSLEATGALMNHPGVATILATGGGAMVKAAYSCGKPALGVGPGNVPAYVEKTCDIKQACHDIVMSKAFDNGMICASEQAAIIDKEIYKEVVEEFKSFGVYFVNEKEKALLEKYAFGAVAYSKEVENARLNATMVGHSAVDIAKAAGIEVPANTVILAAECKEVGVNEPLTREKLSPVIAIIKSNSTDDGIKKAEQMVEFNGLGHSAAIHTKSEAISKEFAEKVKAIRIIWNQPSTFGGIGNVYNSFIPSLTLGCGSYGHNSVSNNVNAFDLLNIKRLGKRRNIMQWFKVPPKIYFEKNSIQYLAQMSGINRVIIVTDPVMVNLGYVRKIEDQLKQRLNNVDILLFSEVEPDPDITTVRRGVEVMNTFKPDTIVALGGGSAMDCAKGMWIFYEHPEVKFDDIKQKFMDIRKRAFKVPSCEKTKLVCIPTTSGTGSEVTPFAVISDKANSKKYPITDYALTPSVAIIDPEFVMKLPKKAVVETGLDVLTHAIEAYTSTLANDFTDGLAMQAIKLVFKYLKKSALEADEEAREKMHYAATLAGMAFANGFLGVCHSLAHKLGGEFHTVHGATNAILLPWVIRYNAQKPTKCATWPKYNYWKADEKFADICDFCGFKYKDKSEAGEVLAKEVEKLEKEIGAVTKLKDLGVDKQAFYEKMDKILLLAFEDQCSPANPKVPMLEDMRQILIKAYGD